MAKTRLLPMLTLAALTLAAATVAVAQPVSDADLAIEKSGPAETAAGGNASFTVTVINVGPGSATDVTISDPLPGTMTFVSASQDSGPSATFNLPAVGSGGTIEASIGTLASGESASFTFVMSIPAGELPGSAFSNIATVSGTSFDPNDENNASVAVTSVPQPPPADVSVTKAGPANVDVDADLTWMIALTNVGPGSASTVQLDDTLPGDTTFVSLTQLTGPAMSCTTPAVGSGGTVTCTIASLAAGTTATFALVTHVPPTAQFDAVYDNMVTVSSTSNDPNDENNSRTASTTVADLAYVDVSVTKTGPPSADPSSAVSYTITVSNSGPDGAQDVTLTDALPPATTFVSLSQDSGPTFSCTTPGVGTNGTISCDIATLASGATAQFTVELNSGDAPSIDNTAAVATSSFDTEDTNNAATASTTVDAVADVSITKSGPAEAAAGSDLTWIVTVSNAGPSAAAGVAVSDPLPAGTTFVSAQQTSGPAFNCTTPAVGGNGTIDCGIALLPAGSSATFSFTANIGASVTAGSSIQNTATVSSQTADPDGANGSTTAATTITAGAVAQQIPSLSPLMLAMLALLLAGVGFAMHRAS